MLDKPIFKKSKVLVGRSVRGRKIWALRQGNPLAPTVLLSIGQMHGSEPAGLKITKRVRKEEGRRRRGLPGVDHPHGQPRRQSPWQPLQRARVGT